MTVTEAVDQACASVGIIAPKSLASGKWLKTDTLAGKCGRGDGRVIINTAFATAWNWQTGEKATIAFKDQLTPVERRQVAQDIARANRERAKKASEAAYLAERLLAAATLSRHPYLIKKGFEAEKALVVGADRVAAEAGRFHDYLIPGGGSHAIIVPARLGNRITSAQLIWEEGTKKFLFGGEIEKAAHRLASGSFTWLCEGFATGLSLRTALRALKRPDAVLCCFSASNVLAVSLTRTGRRAIVTDNDKPLLQYGGIGTGEYFARQSELPYLMPPHLGDDLNDVHVRDGVFAVQRLVTTFLREAAM